MNRKDEFERLVENDLEVRAGDGAYERMHRIVLAAHGSTERTKTLTFARRMVMDKPIVKFAVAAVVVAAVTLGLFEFLSPGRPSDVVWADVAERLRTSSGITVRMRSSHSLPGLAAPVEWEAKIYSDPQCGYRMDRLRDGQTEITTICNNAERKMLVLMHSLKQYTLTNLTEEMQAEIAEKQAGAMDPKLLVQQLLSGGYAKLGRETIDGVETEGVQIDNPPDAGTNTQPDSHIVRLWVGVETGYPVRMENEIAINSKSLHSTQVVDQFEWNIALDPALFQLEIPPDYTEMATPQP